MFFHGAILPIKLPLFALKFIQRDVIKTISHVSFWANNLFKNNKISENLKQKLANK